MISLTSIVSNPYGPLSDNPITFSDEVLKEMDKFQQQMKDLTKNLDTPDQPDQPHDRTNLSLKDLQEAQSSNGSKHDVTENGFLEESEKDHFHENYYVEKLEDVEKDEETIEKEEENDKIEFPHSFNNVVHIPFPKRNQKYV